MENTPTSYAYLTGALTGKLKTIALELYSAGLLKANTLEKAEVIALKAIADAEAAERKFSQEHSKGLQALQKYSQG